MTQTMAGIAEHSVAGVESRRCPRCEVCKRVVRVRGVGSTGVFCTNCISEVLPFVSILSESEYRGAIREYREGLGSRAGEFQDLRFDPFDEEVRGALREIDNTLKGCAYLGGDEVRGKLKTAAKGNGCSLAIMCHNIRSAKGPGIELLEAEIRRWGIEWDVIGLTETWLDKESEKGFSVQGFEGLCASRQKKGGGGVALLIKEGLVYKERPDLNIFKEGIIETVFAELVGTGSQKNDIVGIIYRPPNADLKQFNEEIAKVLERVQNVNTYLMGDFNVDLLKASHRPTQEFIEGFTEKGFFPTIALPTRLTDTTATLIDNIWTNNVTKNTTSGLVTVRISDHLPVFAFIEGLKDEEKPNGIGSKKRLVNERRIAGFADQLNTWCFDEIRAQGIEANVARFRNEFRDMYDTAFPWVDVKKKKRDHEKPWLDDIEFKDLVQEKGKLYKKKLKGQLNEDENLRLREISKEVNKMRLKLKKDYFQQRLNEKMGDLQATWEVLGEVIKGRKGRRGGASCGYFTKDGAAVTEGQKIAEGFCDFYSEVGPKLAAKIPKDNTRQFSHYMGAKVDESLILGPTTPIEVESLCLALEPGKGSGWEGVAPRVIKGVARELAGSLSRLYNCCLREGYYPSCFKVARVVPVFKGGDPTEFSNYRPVSVLPVLSQIFEKIIKARLVDFLERNKVVSPNQYGFRAGHSTAMAVSDMVERVRQAWGRGNTALGIFLDLKKAFDTVDHSILLAKLEHYGIRGIASELLKSYLSDRTQYVVYNGYESERGSVQCGVPQGSVLGPLFFLLYVNDMERACQSLNLVLFADDTNAFAEGKDQNELFSRVNAGLEELSRWFRCNKLTLNLKKTEFIYFRGAKATCSLENCLKIGGETIKRVEGTKFLGIWVDERLKWTTHIEKVKSKIGQLVGVVGRAKAVLGKETLRSLYNGMVLPHLQYCLMVWGDFEASRNLTVGKALLRHQKKLVGMITGQKGTFHSDPLFAELGILKIEDLYRQQLRTHAWHFWNNCLPQNQCLMLQRSSQVHQYATRTAERGIAMGSTDHCSIAYRVPKEWGMLPEELREVKSLSGFKRQSKITFTRQYKEFKYYQGECQVCKGDRGG